MTAWRRHDIVNRRIEGIELTAYLIEAKFHSFSLGDTDEMWWHEFWGGSVLEDVRAVTLSNEGFDESIYLEEVPNVREVTIFSANGSIEQPFTSIRKWCPEIKHIWILGFRGTDAELKSLAKIENLESLWLNDIELNDTQLLSLIDGSPELTVLRVQDAYRLTENAFATIGQLSQLHVLELECDAVTDDHLCSAGNFSELRELSVAGSQVSDRGLAKITRANGLECLNLDRCRVTGDGFESLRTLMNLKSLSIDDIPISETGVQQLSSLTQLETLRMRRTSLRGYSLAGIASLKKLKSVDLRLCELTDDSISQLSKSESLQAIDLSSTTVADASLRHLGEMPALTSLLLKHTRTSANAVAELRSRRSSQSPSMEIRSSNDVWVHDVKTGERKFILARWPRTMSKSGMIAQDHNYVYTDDLVGTTIESLRSNDLRRWIGKRDVQVSAISDDGSRVLVQDYPGIKVLNCNTGAVVFRAEHTDENTFAFATNRIVVGEYWRGTGTVWSLDSQSNTPFKGGNGASELRLSPNGRFLASYNEKTQELLVRKRPDLAAIGDNQIKRFSNVATYAFSINGELRLCRTVDNRHTIMDSQGQLVADVPSRLSNALLSPNGVNLLVWDPATPWTQLHDTTTGDLIWKRSHEASVSQVRFSPDAKSLIIELKSWQ